ncbi:MAG: hypothetical protein J6Z49_06940 [Kiritimatiellae bacterium]|nr:hypothetical protein [Kiritimatiellia bacterium]
MGDLGIPRLRTGQALAAQPIVTAFNTLAEAVEGMSGEDGVRIEKNQKKGLTIGFNNGEAPAPGPSDASCKYVTDISAGSNDWELEISYSDGTSETVTVPHPALVTSVTWDGANGRIAVAMTSGATDYISFVSYNY